MFRIELAGAWEGDALPGGRFCAAYPDGRIVTHAGTWQAPDWLRYPRLHPYAEVVAGCRQAQPGAVVMIDAMHHWTHAPQSCGLSAVIYHPDGTLQVNADCAAPYYSLGFRYIDRSGQIVSGSDTYADSERQIFEWTEMDGITIGQGPVDGVHILVGGRRYLLEPGPARVVRFNKTGEACAVGLFRQDLGFVACSFMVDEIVTFPDITEDDEPPPPVEDEVKPPVVSVQNWTLDELKDGREFVFSDSANPALGYKVRVHVRDGSMYAELENTAGYATTGQKRPVKPCEDSGGGGGNGGHEPPPPQHSPIATDHGTFWQVDRSGVVSHGMREDPFEIGLAENGRYTFKAPNGLYVCAEGGGADNVLIANRDSAGGWEQFTRGPSGSANRPRGFTLQVDNGRYVVAEADGRIACDRPSGGGWETFEAPAMGGGGEIAGRIRVHEQRFTNDVDWWSWRGVSDFDAVWHVLNGDESAVAARFDAYVRAGRTIVRVLGMLAWAHRSFSPRSENYWDALDVVRRLANNRGMYVNLCFFADAQIIVPGVGERESWLDQFGWFVSQHSGVVAQIANEPFKNGWNGATDPALLQLADRLAGVLGHREFSIGDPVDGDDVDASEETTAKLVTLSEYSRILVLHPSRKEGGDNRFRRWVDHLEGITDVMDRMHGATFVHDEPMGASPQYEPGRRDNDPDAHIAAQMVALCCEVGYTYHWITEECSVHDLPGFYNAAELLALIPVSPDWEYKNDSWAGSPTQGYTAWGKEGKVRSLVSGGQAWTVGYGELNWDAIHWASGWTPSEQYRGERVRIWKVTQ